MRIVIVCEHASARFGGESIIPIHWFRSLKAAGEDVWLISHERTRNELTDMFPDCGDRFLFVRDTVTQKLLHLVMSRSKSRLLRILLHQWMHLSTQIRQRPIVRELVQNLGVDWILERRKGHRRDCYWLLREVSRVEEGRSGR